MDVARFYARSPIVVQTAMVTAFGLRERRRRYGGRYRQFLAELRTAQWWSADALQAEQDRRLQETVRFAVERVPYYRRLFGALGIAACDIRTVDDLSVLPLLDKETVRGESDAFTPHPSTERLLPSTTGGTTGTPLRYFVSLDALRYNYATYEARFRNWAGVRFGERMASINGRVIVPASRHRPPFWRHNPAFNQLYLSAYHLSPSHLPAYVDKLRRFRPAVVVGYVSSVQLLSRYLHDSGRIGEVTPRAVLVSSETLFPEVRAEIETAFCCPVFDGYSLGELTAFISQCPEGSMHVSPEYGVVEYVLDGHGRSELVTTGLFNRGTVLLRYRTGDLAEPVAQSCSCGRQLPRTSAIAGRVDDAVVTSQGVRVGPAPLSLAFQSCRGVREAQIVQHHPGQATVLLVTTPDFDEQQGTHLRSELAARLGPDMHLDFEHVDAIPRTSAGKRRLIVSSVAQ